MPRTPLPDTSVTCDRVASSTTSKGITLSSLLLRDVMCLRHTTTDENVGGGGKGGSCMLQTRLGERWLRGRDFALAIRSRTRDGPALPKGTIICRTQNGKGA